MGKKYQVFISSTYEDLREERDKVRDAILSMYHFPVGMELFGAASAEQWEIIKETIDTSDYYVLIVGHRYGTVIPKGYSDAGISYTEKEFRYAKDKGIPILAFIIDKDVPVKVENVEKKHIKKFDEFKAVVMDGRTVTWWKNSDDLAHKVTLAIQKEIDRNPGHGWVREDVSQTIYQDKTDEIDMIRFLMSDKKELSNNYEMVKTENAKLTDELKKCKQELKDFEDANETLKGNIQRLKENEKRMKALLELRKFKKYEGKWIQYNDRAKWPYIICSLLYKDGYYCISGIGFDEKGEKTELYKADVLNNPHVIATGENNSICYVVRDITTRVPRGFGEMQFSDVQGTNSYVGTGYYFLPFHATKTLEELDKEKNYTDVIIDYKMIKHDKYLYERLRSFGYTESFDVFIKKGIVGIRDIIEKYKSLLFFGRE